MTRAASARTRCVKPAHRGTGSRAQASAGLTHRSAEAESRATPAGATATQHADLRRDRFAADGCRRNITGCGAGTSAHRPGSWMACNPRSPRQAMASSPGRPSPTNSSTSRSSPPRSSSVVPGTVRDVLDLSPKARPVDGVPSGWATPRIHCGHRETLLLPITASDAATFRMVRAWLTRYLAANPECVKSRRRYQPDGRRLSHDRGKENKNTTP